MYPAPRVTQLIVDELLPVRIHVKDQPEMWHRFGVRWTPTVAVLGPDGREARRVEGYLPADELRGQIMLGLANVAVNAKQWDEAERWFRRVVDELPETSAAPEAQYWIGVARYSASHDANELAETARRFATRYADTTWSMRAIVWKR